MTYEAVQSSLWDGMPSHYPEVHAREVGAGTARARRIAPSLCRLAHTVHPVFVDPFAPLFEQISCRRCRHMLVLRHEAEAARYDDERRD